MSDLLLSGFDWLRDEQNREALYFVGAAFAAVVIGGWTVYTYGSRRKEKPEGNPTPVLSTVVLSLDDYEKRLKRRADEVTAELSGKYGAERTVLEGELAELQGRLSEPEKALEEAWARIRDLEALVEREAIRPGAKRRDAALAALEAGDLDAADALFAGIEGEAEPAVQSAASAGYGRGQIAEQHVRWADAARHYARAAELAPDFATLFKAAEFAERAGDLTASLRFGERVIDAAKMEYGPGSHEHANALNNHAVTLKAMGRYDEAEPLYREALAIDEKALGKAHPAYSLRLNNLAGLLRATGRYDDAEPLYREALAIDEKRSARRIRPTRRG